jgi:hypothetical protein
MAAGTKARPSPRAHRPRAGKFATDEKIAEAQKFSPGTITPPEAEVMQQLQQEHQRLASYLLCRGVLLPMEREGAFFGVLTARHQGQAEFQECYSLTSRRGEACQSALAEARNHIDLSKGKNEVTKQWEKSVQDFRACLDRSLTPSAPVCDRALRCNKPDKLPF